MDNTENLKTTKGDILLTQCEYLIQGVAERSIEDMGTGVARAIHLKWPESTSRFKAFRSSNRYIGGSIWVDSANIPRIVNLATQEDLYKANIHYLNKALKNLSKYLRKLEPSTIAMPKIGCGYGKLDWNDVRPLIEKHLAGIKHRVFIYELFTEGERSQEETEYFSKHQPSKQNGQVTIIASEPNWIDGKAENQLHCLAKLPRVKHAVGMPDIHAGRNIPVGFAVITEGLLYPHLIGNDIGCGMGLFHTDLTKKKIKLDAWVKKLNGLESFWEGDRTALLKKENAVPTDYESSLGTIGGGNHFAELQCIEEVVEAKVIRKLGIKEQALILLVHSGSRGLGESIKKKYAKIAFHGLEPGSDKAIRYLRDHDNAILWARANRSLIAGRFLRCLKAHGERILDVEHNSVEKYEPSSKDTWIHRKGASPANRGPVVIPGSRGSFSYLVQPLGDQETSAYSLPHGAGRKWSRSDCKDRLRDRYPVEALTRTALGSRVICDNKSLLYQEATQAYKDIDKIIDSLIEIGIIRVIAKLRPVITYKVRH